MSKVIGDGWQKKYPTMEAQAEFFIFKFAKDEDIKRGEVMVLMNQFKTYAKPNKGELEEDEAMRLLEARNNTKTFKELRQMVSDIDVDKNRKLSFLEWACAIYAKSWDKLHAVATDPEEIAKAEAIQAAALAEEEKRRFVEDEARRIEDEKRVHELRAKAEKAAANEGAEASARAKAELEAELARQADALKRRHADEAAEKARREAEEQATRAASLKKQGVAGKVALFKYAAQDSSKNTTKENEEKLKDDIAKKKAIKQQELEALAKKKIADEETAKKKAEAEEAHRRAEIAEKERLVAEEAKARAEAERLQASAKLKEAEEARQRAEELSDKKLRMEYEAKKKEEDEKIKRQKEAEEMKRAEGRAKLAAKSNLWTGPSKPVEKKDFLSSINQGKSSN